MGKPNRQAYKNKLKWWYDLRRYTARIAARSASPAVPECLVLPLIFGLPVAGGTLTADVGRWASSNGAIVYTYQWLNGGANISGATLSTLVTVDGTDEGKIISLRVTATNASGATSATSTALPALT
jgi:hypothetical protein